MTGLSILGSEIGRGHPFYTDGLVRALQDLGAGAAIRRRSDVFEVSRGVSLAAWRCVRAAYRNAGRGGAMSSLYHRVRRRVDYDHDSPGLRVLGRDLRRWAGGEGVVVVDHPAVVGALGGLENVWYFHGELAAPPEAMVRRAARILVPREDGAAAFVAGGCRPEQILVTGLCVENDLVEHAEAMAAARRRRIASGEPLTVAFFSSGAEPPGHVAAVAAAAKAIGRSSHRALVFAARGGRLERAAAGGAVEIVRFGSREELDRETVTRFATIDAVVSPPHERSHWAVGLGVPFFLVGPDIVPFAPRNRTLLLAAGVAASLDGVVGAARLPAVLDDLRASDALLRMSEAGGGVPVDGFRRAARFVLDELRRRGE
ncbi:MAG: hypothetical protein ACT4PE_01775 [Candidatus Eiseniibacteriota bacterium]